MMKPDPFSLFPHVDFENPSNEDFEAIFEALIEQGLDPTVETLRIVRRLRARSATTEARSRWDEAERVLVEQLAAQEEMRVPDGSRRDG